MVVGTASHEDPRTRALARAYEIVLRHRRERLAREAAAQAAEVDEDKEDDDARAARARSES